MENRRDKGLHMTIHEELYYANHLKAYMLDLKREVEYARKISSIREAQGNDG